MPGVPPMAIAVVVPYQTQDLTGAVVARPIVRAVVQAYLNETGGAGAPADVPVSRAAQRRLWSAWNQ